MCLAWLGGWLAGWLAVFWRSCLQVPWLPVLPLWECPQQSCAHPFTSQGGKLAPPMSHWVAGAHAGRGQAAPGRAAALPQRPAGLRHHCKASRSYTADCPGKLASLDSAACIQRSHALTKLCSVACTAALGCHNSPPLLATLPRWLQAGGRGCAVDGDWSKHCPQRGGQHQRTGQL